MIFRSKKVKSVLLSFNLNKYEVVCSKHDYMLLFGQVFHYIFPVLGVFPKCRAQE